MKISPVGLLLLLLIFGTACAPRREKDPRDASTPAGDSALAPERPASIEAAEADPLIGVLMASFQERNPRLAQVGVLDLEAWDFQGPRVVLGWAIVRDHRFRGDFNDEMFGVFVVDESLTRVERVIDIFPTERWFDYEVRFGRLTADSIEVLGRGATYSDGPSRRVYKWW